MEFDLSEHSHRRYNPLLDSWVLVSPHRAKRPWQGAQEPASQPNLPGYDPSCYLCPSNIRAGGNLNPDYKQTFYFINDFSAVRDDQPAFTTSETDDISTSQLLRCEGVRGTCYVICFSPSHNKTLANLPIIEITEVVRVWKQIYEELRSSPFIRNVQIFENKGSAMGCSNPHPHCQIWATESIPNEPAKELSQLATYMEKNGRCLLCDYTKLELNLIGSQECRVVLSNAHFLVVCPYWAVWPFEVLVLSKAHLSSLAEFEETKCASLADIISKVCVRYDNLFQTSFPYSMGIHQAPLNESPVLCSLQHFHLHFYPPLLRSATVKKFLVGFELLGEAQRDLTPETAAHRLRQQSETHYTAQ